MLAAVTWPDVALSLIAAAPGIIAAIYARSNGKQLKTPSGQAIGRQVESVHHVSIANHNILRKQNGGIDEPLPTEPVPDAG